MKSCIYAGSVRHRRFEAADNRFSYPLFLLYLDLDELPEVFKDRWLWSSRHPALAWFRRRDHLYDPHKPLKQELRDLVLRQSGKTLNGPVRLLTHLRYFGYCFNPLSLYFCYNAADDAIDCIVAEVHNTPWGQRHCYVLDAKDTGAEKKFNFQHPKQFYVSPFLDMRMDYHWTITRPASRLLVHIENHRDDNKIFDATLALQQVQLSAVSLARVLLFYPFMTLQVIVLIHWQALKLWLKRVPYIRHPKSVETEEKPT